MQIELFEELINKSHVDISQGFTVFVVEDRLIVKLYEIYGLNHEKFLKFPQLNKFIKNHVTKNSEIGQITTLTGRKYNLTDAKLDNLRIKGRFEKRGINYISVTGILLENAIDSAIKDYSKSLRNIIEQLLKLPYDLFVNMVLRQEIMGKDLISLCLTNEDMNERCNYRDEFVFKRLLEIEYMIRNAKNPRELYVELSMTKIYTFGQNSNGELGLGIQQSVSVPTPIPNHEGIRQVVSGFTHTAFLDHLGQVWISGDMKVIKTDVPVMVEGFRDIRYIACGSNTTAFLDKFGQIWTFGEGYLGHGAYSKDIEPRIIEGFKNVRDVSCGQIHMAFIDELGQLWTFGSAENGRLGQPKLKNRLSPRLVQGTNNLVRVVCGHDYTAYLNNLGEIWTFGKGEAGKLGHGINQDEILPRKIEGFKGIIDVSCGSSHTAFLDKNGKMWTFGRNNLGQLGDLDTTGRSIPVLVQNIPKIMQVSCGMQMTAFIDVKGQLWTFGYRGLGGLGHGIVRNETKPKLVKANLKVRQVSCNGHHTAIVATKIRL